MKLSKIFKRHTTVCNLRFLNKKIAMNDSNALPIKAASTSGKSVAICGAAPLTVHSENTNGSAALKTTASNKYIDCIR